MAKIKNHLQRVWTASARSGAPSSRGGEASISIQPIKWPFDDEQDALSKDTWKNHVLELVWSAIRSTGREQAGGIDAKRLELRARVPEASSDKLAKQLGSELGRAVRAAKAPPGASNQAIREGVHGPAPRTGQWLRLRSEPPHRASTCAPCGVMPGRKEVWRAPAGSRPARDENQLPSCCGMPLDEITQDTIPQKPICSAAAGR